MDLVDAIPLPALVVDAGIDGLVVAAGNDEATTLLGSAGAPLADLLGGWFAGRLDPPSQDKVGELVRDPEATPSATLRWGDRAPYTWIEARGRRLDDGATLVVLVDETETHRLDAVLTAFENATFGMDAELRIRWMSRGMVSAYGVPYPLGSEPLSRMHPEDIPAAHRVFSEALAHPRRRVHATTRASSADFPEVFWQLDYTVMNLLDDPAVGAVVSTFGPHTALPGEEDSPPDVDVGVNRLSDIMPAGVVQATADGTCYYRNRMAEQQLGGVAYGDHAETWIARAREQDRELLLRALEEVTAGKRSEPVVAAYAGSTAGSLRWYRIEFTPQNDQHGTPSGWVATTLDITAEVEARDELHRAQQHLWELANHDALTGLPNRPAILDRINAALTRAQREPHPVALLFCDLDGFKPVNDDHGHEAGDEVLRIVAGRMQAVVRASDTVGRLGGDEFVILCETFATDVDVLEVADRVRSQVCAPMALTRTSPPTTVTLDISIGVAIAAPHDTSATLLARADRSMYDAKPRRR